METTTESEISLTREELYAQVWSEPMWTLAARFGLSDVGLAKTCRRYQIPVPPRGYWQQKQAGQAVKRTKLPKLAVSASGRLAAITFRRTRPAQSDSAGSSSEIEKPVVVVADELTDPHPLVAHTIVALRRIKPAKNGVFPRAASADYLDVRVSLGTVDRTMRILDAFVRACEARGYEFAVQVKDKETVSHVVVNGESISFHVEEAIDSVLIPPEERKATRGMPWAPTPDRREVPSGLLGFHIDANWYWYSGNLRRSWRDGKKQRLEECLGHVLVGLQHAAAAVKASREESEARDRRFKEEERKRKHNNWLAHCEKRRSEVIQDDLNTLRQVQELRSYVELRRRAAPDPSPVLEEWLTWVAGHADSLEERILTHAGPKIEPFNENSYYY